ncbi:uncharacterized protein [Nicotiana sylvestris]|uniref:uncharacterized protein n=1 Tax=Nicotiana sylvestris TaxID=4096 RepID=UPI00388C47A2
MDVEVCSNIKVVKYLYKYIYKGHDKIAFYVHDNDTNKEIDEIKEYQSARWVSPPKADWRLFSFSISEMYPSVYHLQLHLKGQQLVSFKGKTMCCNPANPKEIWKQFEEQCQKITKCYLMLKKKDIQYQVLNQINDILHSMGHNVNEYELIPEIVQLSILEKEAKEIFFERTIRVGEEDILLHKKLNTKQLKAYNVIIDQVFSKKPGAFFIDDPGGTGKTFLYHALLATIHSKGYIALAIATSSIAASILPGGRTAHSRLKIHIDIDENFSCNISKQSSTASLIRDAKLIVWDEVSMAKKRMLDIFDLLLKDLMDTNILFGGKLLFLEVTLDKLFQLFETGIKKILLVKVYYILPFGTNLKNCNYLKI